MRSETIRKTNYCEIIIRIFGKIATGNKIITYICENNDRYYAYDFYLDLDSYFTPMTMSLFMSM